MPPAAATEWERTGWTFEMIATDAPASAADSAARWPARPAPMISTSCDGTTPILFGEPPGRFLGRSRVPRPPPLQLLARDGPGGACDVARLRREVQHDAS